MQIEKIPISHINPAKYNPRKDLKPGDPEYEHLKRSIETFGLVDPLIWNRRTGNLVGGHQRFKILKARGDTEVDVSVVDLDDTHEKALNIALNKISGDWDKEKLIELFSTMKAEDIEITKKLVEAGKIMGIDVLDHVIIGDGRHFSMKEAGYI